MPFLRLTGSYVPDLLIWSIRNPHYQKTLSGVFIAIPAAVPTWRGQWNSPQGAVVLTLEGEPRFQLRVDLFQASVIRTADEKSWVPFRLLFKNVAPPGLESFGEVDLEVLPRLRHKAKQRRLRQLRRRGRRQRRIG